MATLVTKKNGKTPGYDIQWYDENNKRVTIYLGGSRYSKKIAEEVKEIVETLLLHQWCNNSILPKKTLLWLEMAPKDILSKLEKVGLITIDKPKTCQELWDSFLRYKAEEKRGTCKVYCTSRQRFFEAFSATDPLDEITMEKLLIWRQSLCSKYAEATVATTMTTLKTVFNYAVDIGWLQQSPMKKVPVGSFVNRKKDRFITVEESRKLLEACPNQEWRAIIALARYGGLRCPSELMQLRYSDIYWEQHRFTVRSSKTERHKGHQERCVPLFLEIRKELEKLRLERESKDDDFVIQGFAGKKKWDLSHPFRRIAQESGLGIIARPFDNMRMSRSNEIERKFGSLKESIWLGHSESVKKKHYFQLTDDDFSKAVQPND